MSHPSPLLVAASVVATCIVTGENRMQTAGDEATRRLRQGSGAGVVLSIRSWNLRPHRDAARLVEAGYPGSSEANGSDVRRYEEFSVPAGDVPERYRDLLDNTALGHLATIGRDGRPQVNPVWFLSDGKYVYLSMKPETAKYRNLRTNPFVAMSVGDPVRPDRYVEVRGEAIEFELFDTLAWVNQLARKYTGADFTAGSDGEHRYKVTILIKSWTGQG